MKDAALFLLNASVQAGWLALALIAVRLIFRKAPKKLLCALWALVGLRLAVPVSLRSVFSLLPSAAPVAASSDVGGVYVQTGLQPVDNRVNTLLQSVAAPTAPTRELAAQTAIDWKAVLAVVWICGVAVMLLYAAISFLRLRLQVREAVKEDGNVYICDRVGTPFILGVVRPRIYLPSSLDAGDRAMILLHERAHLKRRDHLWKPLGFLLLSVYWFNPVLWVVYVLLCRDIELACDERVLRQQGSDIKKEYASALLRCSAPRHLVRACPVAFGEVGVKARIKSVLNYKKPAFWVILLALVASAVVAVCFMTIPKERAPAVVTVLDTGSDSEAVAVQPESVSLDRQTLHLEVTYVNNSDQPIEANETVWMLREADGTYAPLEVRNKDWDTALRFRLPAQEQQTYNYTPSAFCDCTAPGAYRFQVHFRFADEPENSYPHLLWFDFKITSPEEPNALVPLPDGMDQAIHEAILKDNADGYWGGECAAEGHVVYGVEQTGSTWTVYLYHGFERYGFINGYFTDVSGHWSVAVLTMEQRDGDYTCKQIDYPRDGSENAPSIKRLFPKRLERRALNPTQSDIGEVERQCTAQAEKYLRSIDRSDAQVVRYGDLNLQLPNLTADVSNKLSNALSQFDGLYELSLGTREQPENGVRCTYRTSFLSDTNSLLFVKEVFGSDVVRELMLFSAETGELLYRDAGRTEPNELHRINARATGSPGARNRLMMPTHENLWTDGVWVNTETFSGQSTKAAEDEYVTIYFNYPVAESHPEQMPYVHAICYMGDVYDGVGAIDPQMDSPANREKWTTQAANVVPTGPGVDPAPTATAVQASKLTADDYTKYDASNGLTVYVWKMSENKTRYGLLPGAPESHTIEQTADMPGVRVERMREILQGYHISPEKVYVKPFQIPISSYLWEFDSQEQQRQREALGLTVPQSAQATTRTSDPFAPSTTAPSKQEGAVRLQITESLHAQSPKLFYTLENASAYRVRFMESSCFIERKSGGNWETLPFAERTMFEQMFQQCDPGRVNCRTIDLMDRYGHLLDAGDYRLRIEYWILYDEQPEEKAWISTNFSVAAFDPTAPTRSYTPEELGAINRFGENGANRFPKLKESEDPLFDQAFAYMNTFARFKDANVRTGKVSAANAKGNRTVTLYTDCGDFVVTYDSAGVVVSDNQ